MNSSRQVTPAAWSGGRWVVLAISLSLACVVWVVFGQTVHHDFVNYDDDAYVYENPAVKNGLSLSGLAAAFAESDARLWTPLTRISHMIVSQVFGLRPWGHHLSNVLLHGTTAILLFLTLRHMTAALWRSAFVAAVFALHPLRVESVAWVSERKDTLSGLFFVLTLLAYAHYVRRTSSRLRYVLVIALFALGLMAKPMLVTLPFVLLLLDYWPLHRVTVERFRFADWWPLVAEKLPLFALTGLSLWFVVFDPFALNGPAPVGLHPPLSLRLANAVVSYGVYLWQMFYPVGLAVRYPFPTGGVPLLAVAASAIVLTAITTAAYLGRVRRPYLLVGWLWYLGMLVPVSQIITLGSESHCDRYTYLPHIGLYIMVAWASADLIRASRHRRIVVGAAAGVSLSVLGLMAHAQAAHWKDSVSLWTHTAATASPDWLTYNHLGLAMTERGRFDEAIRYFEQALQGNPDPAQVENNIAIALAGRGDLPEAAQRLERALSLKPRYPEARDNLGLVLARQGKLDQAIEQYQRALTDKPDLAQAHNNLGMAFAAQGKFAEAEQSYRRALELRWTYGAAHLNLGMLVAAQGKLEEAITHYDAALKLEPTSPAAYNNLAWLLATSPSPSIRNGGRAVQLATEAARLTGEEDPSILDTLAAAHAEAGDYDNAVNVTTRAIQLARTSASHEFAAQLETRRQLYLRREPYRDRG